MFGLYIYQLYEAERPKTAAQQRAADIRSGETAAAISHQLRTIKDVVRSLAKAATARRSVTVTPPPAPSRCPDAAIRNVLATASASAGCSAGWHGPSDAPVRTASVS
jgi:hypothetical protein